MTLVLTEKLDVTTMIGDTCLSITRTKRGQLRIVIDSPEENLVTGSRNLKKALAVHGWVLEKSRFYATHPEHGQKHLRELVHLLKEARNKKKGSETHGGTDI